jgi:hypothetical protein
MRDPVVTSDGQSYERSAIERWILLRRRQKLPVTSPLTGLRLEHTKLTPNIALRNVNENIQRKRKLQTFDEGAPNKKPKKSKYDQAQKYQGKKAPHELRERRKLEAQALLVLSIFSRHFSEFAKWIKKQFVTNTRLTTLDSFVWKDDKTVDYKITAYGQEINGTMGVVKNHNAGYQNLPKTQVLYKQHLCKLIPYVNGQNVIALAQSLSDEVKDKLRRAVREEVNKFSLRISSEAGSVCYWLRERKTNYRRCVSFYHKVKNWILLNLKDNTEMSSGVLRWETTVTKLFVPRRQEKRTLTKGDLITQQTFKDLLRLHPRGTFDYTPEVLTYFGEGWFLLSDKDVKEAYDNALMKMEEKLNEVICEKKTANDEAALNDTEQRSQFLA